MQGKLRNNFFTVRCFIIWHANFENILDQCRLSATYVYFLQIHVSTCHKTHWEGVATVIIVPNLNWKWWLWWTTFWTSYDNGNFETNVKTCSITLGHKRKMNSKIFWNWSSKTSWLSYSKGWMVRDVWTWRKMDKSQKSFSCGWLLDCITCHFLPLCQGHQC